MNRFEILKLPTDLEVIFELVPEPKTPDELKQEIISKYPRTAAGRARLAQSMVWRRAGS